MYNIFEYFLNLFFRFKINRRDQDDNQGKSYVTIHRRLKNLPAIHHAIVSNDLSPRRKSITHGRNTLSRRLSTIARLSKNSRGDRTLET